jgi:hypothetical protein
MINVMNSTPNSQWRHLFIVVGLLGSRLLMLPAKAEDNARPDPLILLQGVESARLQIPASTLTVEFSYTDSFVLVSNEMILHVDFDGDLRGFDYQLDDQSKLGYRTVFDGSRAICYYEDRHLVEYRNLTDQTPMQLFDPRVLGISAHNAWEDNIRDAIPYRYEGAKPELIGREAVEDRVAWHVRLTIKPLQVVADYWIDDTNGFRVYRKDWNVTKTFSYYENESYPWLPSRVESKDYRYAKDGNATLQSEMKWQIVDAKADVKFPKSRWTLAGMDLKQGTEVTDVNLRRRIGNWNGSRFVPSIPDSDQRRNRPMAWSIIALFLVVIVPVILMWLAKRRPSKANAS